MKFVGATVSQIFLATKAVDPKCGFKVTEQSDWTIPAGIPTVSGYWSYGKYDASPYKLVDTKTGMVLHKPCLHAMVRMVAELFKVVPTARATVHYVPLKPQHFYTDGTLYSSKWSKLAASKKLAGTTCGCADGGGAGKGKVLSYGLASTSVIVAPAPAPASPAPPKPTPPTKWVTYQPIEAEPITDGETKSFITIKIAKKRDIFAASVGLYLLFELEGSLRAAQTGHGADTAYRGLAADGRPVFALPENWADLGCVEQAEVSARAWQRYQLSVRRYSNGAEIPGNVPRWLTEFRQFKTRYETRFARNLLDYLTIAAFGEARHAKNIATLGAETDPKPSDRDEASKRALDYDPRTTLPCLAEVFKTSVWSSGFGGKKWATIAKAAALYFKFRQFPVVFADHCVDLAHNGGLAFDKGYIFSNPDSMTRYMAMLDAKRQGSLMLSPEQYPCPLPVLQWLNRLLELGAVKPPNARFRATLDPEVPTALWGSDKLSAGYKTGAAVSHSGDDDDDDDAPVSLAPLTFPPSNRTGD